MGHQCELSGLCGEIFAFGRDPRTREPIHMILAAQTATLTIY